MPIEMGELPLGAIATASEPHRDDGKIMIDEVRISKVVRYTEAGFDPPTKELISLRIDQDVVAAYRATGPGWQARMNEALRAGLRGR